MRCCSYNFSSRSRSCLSLISLRLARRFGTWRLFFSRACCFCVGCCLLACFDTLLFLSVMIFVADDLALAPYPHFKCFAQCLCPGSAKQEQRQLLPSFLVHRIRLISLFDADVVGKAATDLASISASLKTVSFTSRVNRANTSSTSPFFSLGRTNISSKINFAIFDKIHSLLCACVSYFVTLLYTFCNALFDVFLQML